MSLVWTFWLKKRYVDKIDVVTYSIVIYQSSVSCFFCYFFVCLFSRITQWMSSSLLRCQQSDFNAFYGEHSNNFQYQYTVSQYMLDTYSAILKGLGTGVRVLWRSEARWRSCPIQPLDPAIHVRLWPSVNTRVTMGKVVVGGGGSKLIFHPNRNGKFPQQLHEKSV